MTYRGRMQNSQVVFDGTVALPNGTEVLVEPIEAGIRRTLAERFRNVIDSVPDLPVDMAAQHDHYVHATPRL